MSRKIIKPQPISGFPEYTPALRRVELSWLDHIRAVFERYGFCNIETPAVEALDVIAAKGEVDKEIYVLERVHKEGGEKKEARLGLRFDQTVPLARYTAQHFNDLVFPFKRYQIQKVWRGERPQAGPFREFTQADIDVIGVDALPVSCDAELAAIMYEVLSGLPGMAGRKVQIRVSNRKIVSGLIKALEIPDHHSVMMFIDKGVVEDDNPKHNALYKIVQGGLGDIPKDLMTDEVRAGVDELQEVLDQLSHLPEGAVVADLSIVRGLDYYTGTVYETFLEGAPDLGSICSGGRYDDLAGAYINKSLPGAGLSIGVSRLFDHMVRSGALDAHIGRVSPAEVLVVVPPGGAEAAARAGRALRGRGIATEVYHAPVKLKRQLAYAEKKGVPHVWFPPFEAGKPHEVKDMTTGVRGPADPDTWTPPARS